MTATLATDILLCGTCHSSLIVSIRN